MWKELGLIILNLEKGRWKRKYQKYELDDTLSVVDESEKNRKASCH